MLKTLVLLVAFAGLCCAGSDPLAEPHDPITVRVLTSGHTELVGVALGSEGLSLSVTVWLDREEATGLRDRLTEALRKKD